MSVTGSGTLSLRKQDVLESKDLAIGFKKTVFAHKATAGDSGINLSALVLPPEMTGFLNPTTAELLAAQILFYRRNLTLISSLRGVLMDYLSYSVADSNTINFVGFTAADGEIFTGIIDYNPRNGLQVVDAAPLVASGTLAVGANSFNVGQVFEINKYSSQQVGAVIVYRNGIQQFRNSNNSSVVLDGNYYEVNNGSGLGSVIFFNNAPASQPDNILVVSNGLLVTNPDGSALQSIESLAGQIDQMIPTLATLAGVPQSTFQAAPNNVDLKSFGDIVLGLMNMQIPIKSDIVNAGPLVFGGTTTAPTVGTTTVNAVTYYRDGRYAVINYDLNQTSSGTGGSGDYLLALPSGLQLDTTVIPVYTGSVGTGLQTVNAAQPSKIETDGNLTETISTYTYNTMTAYAYSSTQVRVGFFFFNGGPAVTTWGSGNFTLANATQSFNMTIRVPILGWSATQTVRQYLQSVGINV